MPIKNLRRLITANIQSDPVDHGNNLTDDAPEIKNSQNVSVVIDNKKNDDKNPLLDNSKISFSTVKRNRTKRSDARGYSIAKKIPTSSMSRTFNRSMVSSLGIRDFSLTTLYNPYYNKDNKPVQPKKNIPAQSSRSEIKIGSMSGMDRYLAESSISNLRPEIIASFDWMPARYSSGRKGWIESLIEFRWVMRMLQIENVEETMKRLKDVDLGGAFSRLEAKYDYYSEKEEMWLEWREKILEVLNNARQSLDIKDNERNLKSSTAKYLAELNPQKGAGTNNTSLKDLFINELKFSEEGYERFSNSKVYGQLIWDLYYACRYHSPGLITTKDYYRTRDRSSTKIRARVIPRTKNYKFRIWKLGNKEFNNRTTKFDATKYKDYSTFTSSLPSDEGDRIKVLTTSISNELTISAGIGYLEDTTLGKRFNVDLSNPLWYPLGRVRKNILTDGWPRGSLSSLVLLKDDQDRLILPFETREFSDVKGRTATPGSKALVDGIMRFGRLSDGLDYEPYYRFGKELDETSQDVANYLDELLNLTGEDQSLHAKQIYSQAVKGMLRCISGLSNPNSKNEQQLIIASLFRLANENKRIKHTLLRYILEVRDARDQLLVDTGEDDFLEPDADDPKPRPPSPTLTLRRFGSFGAYRALNASIIQKRYGFSPNLAMSLVANTSSFGNLYKSASDAAAKEKERRRKEYYRLARKWQRTSLWLSILCRSNIDSQRRPPGETDTRSILKTSDQAIVYALRKAAKGNRTYDSPFSHIIRLARKLQTKSSELANKDSAGGSYMSSTKLTKYNGWDENALIAAIFEIYCALYSRFVDAEMVSHGENIYVKYIPETNSRFRRAISDSLSIERNSDPQSKAKQLKEKKESFESQDDIKLTSDMLEGKLSVLDALQSASNQSSQLAVFSDVYSFFEAFEKETEFKCLLISHLQAIGNRAGRSADVVKVFFNTKDEDLSPAGTAKYKQSGSYLESSRIRRYLAWKAQSTFGRAMLRSMTEHQVALQRVTAKKLARKEGDPSYLPAEMIIEAEEIAALKSLLNSPSMRGVRGDNIRVMTVGIPCETIDILQNPPYTIGRRNSELIDASGVFEVHVHKRDLEYEDIIFKPKKFIYDRSLFLMSDAFSKITPAVKRGRRKRSKSWTYDQVVKEAKFTNATYANLAETDAVSLYKSYKYRNIPESKRTEMISNHVSNRLLHIYYRLLNGMTMDEGAFLKENEWGQLLVDSDAGQLLQLSQMAGETSDWIYTGTVPVGNLLINTKIQKQSRTRVATFKDGEIWTRPTSSQLARLARDLRIARYGYLPAYKKYRKLYSRGEVYQILNKRRGRGKVKRYNRAIEKSYVNKSRSGLKRSVRFANPSQAKKSDYFLTKSFGTYKSYGFTLDPNQKHPIWKKWVELGTEYNKADTARVELKKKRDKAESDLRAVRRRLNRMVYKIPRLRRRRDSLKKEIKQMNSELDALKKKSNRLKDEWSKEYHSTSKRIRAVLARAEQERFRRKVTVKTRQWNQAVRKYNLATAKKNLLIRKKRSKLMSYQRRAYRHIARRFYRKKPRLDAMHLQHFRMICASSIMGPCAMINKVLAPRTFDRVLMIPVDPDDFEINMKATKNLLNSKSIEEKREFKNMITITEDEDGNRTVKLKPRRRAQNFSSFNDFFVTISSVSLEDDD